MAKTALQSNPPIVETTTIRKFNYKTLTKYLCEKYKTKRGGSPFTHQDIYQYIERGRIPKAYGGNKINRVPSVEIEGVDCLEVSFEIEKS